MMLQFFYYKKQSKGGLDSMNIKFEIKNFKKIVELVDNANYKIAGEEENINKPSIFIKASADSVILVALI